MTNQTVRVWDIAVRLFHWSLVGFFTIAYLTGEEGDWIHAWSGYAVLGLILFRILWGFIGTRHARFSDFLYSRREVADYLRNLAGRNPRRYLGHTPAGGWMIVALLTSLLLTSLTGLKIYGIEGQGPLAANEYSVTMMSVAYADSDDRSEYDGGSDEELWEEVHEFFANLTLFLVFFHIAGVVLTGRLHKENLVKSMVTGNKETPQAKA